MSALHSGGINIETMSDSNSTTEAMAHGNMSMAAAAKRRHFSHGVQGVFVSAEESTVLSVERVFSSGFSGEFKARTKNAAMMAPSESTPRIGK